MSIVVIDTNVLASGVLGNSNPPARVIDAWMRGDFDLVLSEPLVKELRRTIDKPYFRGRATPIRVERLLSTFTTEAIWVTPAPVSHPIATHPEDDLILATAVAGLADYLVTGDRQLLALGTYAGVRIVSPSEFLALLAAED